jgi:AhpD family alkylhydroperoxidase
MPRLRYIADNEQTAHTRELIESAKRTGAPDPRVVSLMTRSKLGIAWVEYWNKLLYQGVLPHKLKEMCRIKISVAHQCGYCSTVRSNVAKADGLTESMINDLFDYAGSAQLTAREKAALRYADLFKQGEHAIDKDEVYAELAGHFSDEEIIELGLFCAEVDGVGKFVKSLNVLSWEEACELNPRLGRGLAATHRCTIIADQFAASRFAGAGFQRSAALSSLALASIQILSALLPPSFSTCFQNGARVLR